MLVALAVTVRVKEGIPAAETQTAVPVAAIPVVTTETVMDPMEMLAAASPEDRAPSAVASAVPSVARSAGLVMRSVARWAAARAPKATMTRARAKIKTKPGPTRSERSLAFLALKELRADRH